MTEFDIGKFKYTWKGSWEESVSYDQDNIVYYNGSSWVCLIPHTSLDFYTDRNSPMSKWKEVTSGMEYAGQWQPNVTYEVGCAVSHNSNVYISLEKHSSLTFQSNKWSEWLTSLEFKGVWQPNFNYETNDVVRFGSATYKCIVPHTAAMFTPSYWLVVSDANQFKGFYAPATQYSINDIVSYNGQLYSCNTAFTSGLSFDYSKWNSVSSGSQYTNTWNSSTVYVPGDIVKLSGKLYYCVLGNTNQKPFSSSSYWRTLSSSAKFKGEWSNLASYDEGDAVRRGSNVYVALADNTNQFNSSYWKLIITGFNWKGSWEPNRRYYENENVFYLGSTYTCIVEHNSSHSLLPSETASHWYLALPGRNSGLTSTGEISVNTTFGNSVKPAGIRASEPGEVLAIGSDNTLTYTQWNDSTHVRFVSPTGVDRPDFGILPSQPWKTLRFACKMVEQLPRIVPITIKVANGVYYETLPITVPANVLVQGGGTAYANKGTANSVRIVPSVGVNSVSLASTQIQSSINFFRTVVESVVVGEPVVASASNSYTQFFNPVTTESVKLTVRNLLNSVLTHVDYRIAERLTSIVEPPQDPSPTDPIYRDPGYTSVDYLVDQFSFVTVHPYLWKTGLRSKFVKPILVSPGTPTTPTVDPKRYYAVDLLAANPDCWFIDDNPFLFHGALRNKFIGYSSSTPQTPPSSVTPVKYNAADYLSSVGQWVINEPFLYSVSKFKTLIDKQVFNMGVPIGGNPPVVTPDEPSYKLPSKLAPVTIYGSSVVDSSVDISNCVTILEYNRNFIVSEFVSYVTSTYGNWIFNSTTLSNIANELITSIKNDLLYSSNYHTQTAAHYISVLITGSAGYDVFRLQNGSVIETLSVHGVVGGYTTQLLTKDSRPSGSICFTLDPGFGTGDSRAWITSTPPVISNVNVVGQDSVGIKVDGGLHANGLKTISLNTVSFINNRGIGVWCNNSGKVTTNHVSIMYAHASAVAEAGGSITSTSSVFNYGKFGAISSGRSGTEVPAYASVTSLTQPVIANASFVTTQDQILGFEFSNNGSNYSSCTGTVTGAGRNCNVSFEEFLNNSVHEVQVLNGGANVEFYAGYCLPSLGNIAIIDSTSLLPSQIEGLRIVIESGPGAGQYGIVSSYNFTTKTVSVVKESTNTPGWDLINTSTELVPLTDESRFRIEPRVIATAPQFTSVVKTVPTTYSVISSVSGNAKRSFNNVPDLMSQTSAQFNVSSYGKTYTVTLSTPGNGYTAGDIITLTGSQLGGLTPQNDLKIVVTKVNETGSVVDFTYTGISSGTINVMTTDTNVVLVSTNGNTWQEYQMPETGRWEAVAHGNGKFVAVGFNTAVSAVSDNGTNWTQGSLPSKDWISVAYGSGVFVAVAQNGNSIAYSENGISWTEATLPVFGSWKEVVYGNGRFVFVSSDTVVVGVFNNGFSFQTSQASSFADQISCAYGAGRFVILNESGRNFSSANGINWVEGQSNANGAVWKQVRYGNGIFFAISTTPVTGSNVCAISDTQGISWELKTLSTAAFWETIVFADFVGSQNNTSFWLAIPSNPSNQWNKINAGARYIGRAVIKNNKVESIKTWNPGSGYTTAPSVSVISKDNTIQVSAKISNGVIAQPVITNRGTGYRVLTTKLHCIGNGVTNTHIVGSKIEISTTRVPTVGGIVRLQNGKEYTITKVKRLLNTTEIEVFPQLLVADNVNCLDTLNFFNDVSAIRLTSHIFDKVGTGDIEETASTGIVRPENIAIEEMSGQVVYSALTDAGVFTVGNVFTIDQQKGLVTMSADAYGIEIDDQLVVPRIKSASGETITEFSNDGSLVENSNSIVPTQRAIKEFITNNVTENAQDLTSAELSAGNLTFTNNEITSNNGPIVVSSPSIVMKQSSGVLFANMFYQSGRI